IGIDGKMTELAGPEFAGLDRFDARKLVVQKMEELGLLVKIEDYTIQLPLCDRCGTVIEPLLSEQWFAKQQEIAEPAMKVVQDGLVNFVPDRYARIYLEWMGRIQPWCISRQLWWGHRIPVWWTEDGKYSAGRDAADAATRLGVDISAVRQDEDVLDTWFSSALWPHATLGWPHKTADLDFWYPTNLLSTAQDIVFLWVARMIMTGLDFMGEIPFHDVYVHATVLDEKGDRMSKSKGNGVDPLVLIAQYGADALRFYLLQHAGKNQDIKYREEGVKLAGQFCNKLWNASRFVMMNLEGTDNVGAIESTECKRTVPDRWILSRLNATVEEVNSRLATYDMDDAMRAIYFFLWDEFCDWYLEIVKPRLREESKDRDVAQAVVKHVLETTLRLLHPMTPFITEEIWHALLGDEVEGKTILLATYPAADTALADPTAEAKLSSVIDTIRAFRNMRQELGLPIGQKLPAAFVPTNVEGSNTVSTNLESILHLARLTDLAFHSDPPAGSGWVGNPVELGEIFLQIGDALDVPKELERIEKELASLEGDLVGSDAKLSNAQFTDKAPAAIVNKEREYNAGMREKQTKLAERRTMLSAIK
ncbi:MAG: class I tRNA ligase family protein, partial [Chthonomonadales bacterium]